ncbi:MAG: AraC family transcriptional regulator [Prolixibacteraceae bacterium]
MSFLVAQPSAFLAKYIKQFWMIENCIHPGNSYSYRIVPNGLMELNFYHGEKPQINEPNKQLTENTLISGQQKCACDLHINKNLSLFSITFQPLGAKAFFNIPMSEFCDRNIPLRFINRKFADKLESQLFEAKSFQKKIALAEKLLEELFVKKQKEYNIARISDSIGFINAHSGKTDVEELAGRACLGRKQYERIFSECIGISPKRFLKIVRFQHSIFLKQQNSEINFTHLACDSGYFDQSHMISDFRQLSGMTPTQFFTECEPYSDYFSP